LDRARIVEAAVELMDSDGLAGLSMRKLATRVGTAPMTLYGHVATKDDVLEFALDGVFAEALAAGESGDGAWRERLRTIAHSTFDAFLRHPWAPTLLGSKPPIGPAAVAHFSSILGALSEAGLGDDARAPALSAFYYYILGAAVAESAWTHGGRPLEGATGADLEDLQSLRNRDISSALSVIDGEADGDPRRRFDAGLTLILDGLNG
jgi:AcrR family transcriptional regulator